MKKFQYMMGVLGSIALLAGCTDGASSSTECQGLNCDHGIIDDGHFCGDHFCDDDEDESTCAKDCAQVHKAKCGDNMCEKLLGETLANCPADCEPICGDGRCEENENPDNCELDCTIEIPEPVCGNRQCEVGETEESCEKDCKPNQFSTQALTLEEFNELNETSAYHFMFDYDKAKNPVVPDNDTIKRKDAMNDFLAFPFPSDVRTDSNGHPDLKGYPVPPVLVSFLIGDIVNSLVETVQTERAGFSPLGAVYFRASAPIDKDSWNINFMNTTSPNSCVQLINVEPESPYYKERVPVYITFQNKGNDLWADNTLVVRPVPGVNMHPGDRHMAVIMDCMRSNGQKFTQSEKLSVLLDPNKAPYQINESTAFYARQLDALGIDKTKVHAMAGFDTMNPAEEMDQMAEALKGKGKIVTDSSGVAVGTWRHSGNVSVFRGTFETYNFIEGNYNKAKPDYTTPGAGVIRFNSSGKLTSAGHKEVINFEITVPQTAMPAKGYPIAVYGHGTGGDASSHSGYYDEGAILIRNGVPMAMIGFDACLQGDRTEGDGSEASLMTMLLQNPVVIRESVRQTVNDMLVLYDIIGSGKLILPPNPQAVDSKSNVKFDPDYGLFMGHSQGSQEGGLLLGLTGDIQNAFLSAGGGGVALSFVELKPLAVKGFEDKTIADIVGLALAQTTPISYDTFITNHIVQPLLDPIDPLNFAHRFIKDPPAGMTSKNIAQTMGRNDQCTPMITQMALATSIGLPVVGNVYEVSDAMKYAGFDKPLTPPVSNNITTRAGQTVTGGFMQFDYTGTSNPHFVIYRMEAGENAYIDFFDSVLKGQAEIKVDTSKQSGSN